MGSSPVTATMPLSGSRQVSAAVAAAASCFAHHRIDPRTRGLVAFSGGSDSLALLLVLLHLTDADRLLAVHVDHRLDPDSGERARQAALLCDRLGIPFRLEHLDPPPLREPQLDPLRRGGVEAWARRSRYSRLLRVRRQESANWVATGHHLDDQAETVLHRIWRGSGLAGLAAVRPRKGPILRPLLRLPKSALTEAVAAAGLASLAVIDPTNEDLRFERNRIRHLVLPRLGAPPRSAPALAAALAAVAERITPVLERIEATLGRSGHLRESGPAEDRGLVLDVRGLGEETFAAGLAILRLRAGAAPGRSLSWLEMQRTWGRRPGGEASRDLGGGWWLGGPPHALRLRRGGRRANLQRPFSYTFLAAGSVDIPELRQRLFLEPGEPQPWMFGGDPRRAGMTLEIAVGEPVLVRNRRPGDRIRPLGSQGDRRLKEVLIDRKVPREDRDSLPLLWVGGRLAWVPGVTIDESFRLRPSGPTWVARLEPMGDRRDHPASELQQGWR